MIDLIYMIMRNENHLTLRMHELSLLARALRSQSFKICITFPHEHCIPLPSNQ